MTWVRLNGQVPYSRERVCSMEGCHKKHFGKGLCATHYARFRQHGTTDQPVKERQSDLRCTIGDCQNKRLANGLCRTHYERLRNQGRLTVLSLEDRFWMHVIKTESCWIWTGNRDKDGYGNIGNGPRDSYKLIRAHRLSYALHKGEVPDNLFVCHTCDKPYCVNPDHLFLGTAKDNENDKVNKGRQAKGERNGNSKYARSLRRESSNPIY